MQKKETEKISLHRQVMILKGWANESASPISPPAAGPMDDAQVERNKEKQQEKGKEKEENIVKIN